MQDYIEQRVLEISNYILETGATVRHVARIFGVSKSTVYIVLRTGVGCIGCSSTQHDR
jgi:transposase